MDGESWNLAHFTFRIFLFQYERVDILFILFLLLENNFKEISLQFFLCHVKIFPQKLWIVSGNCISISKVPTFNDQKKLPSYWKSYVLNLPSTQIPHFVDATRLFVVNFCKNTFPWKALAQKVFGVKDKLGTIHLCSIRCWAALRKQRQGVEISFLLVETGWVDSFPDVDCLLD